MTLKTLLVAFTTMRPGASKGDKPVRARFGAGSVVDLTDDELTDLQSLQDKTGKLHFRDPSTEGGKAVASDPVVTEVPDFAGQDVAIGEKTVPQLKAYLDFNGVEYPSSAGKGDLVTLATTHEAGVEKKSDDPDAGL